jgi:hypothetical protein
VEPPANEAQARPLAGLDVDEAAEVLEDARAAAAEEGRAVTAADIDAAAEERRNGIDVAAEARLAGIDPATLRKPPETPAMKAARAIEGYMKKVEKAAGPLDAGPQERVERGVAEIRGGLADQT